MGKRINRAIELLADGQPVYYMGAHTGHTLTYESGREDAATWADYINVGMEHGAFDMAGLEAYLGGMVDAGPARSGHRTPAVLVEVPVDGSSEATVRSNSWQFRQILGRGAHGVLLCHAESPDAVRAFVESCRYPINQTGVGGSLGVGRRGIGSEDSASAIWGIERDEYILRADPWPLNPQGELLMGVKIESLRGMSKVEEILRVPGIGFAEVGQGDLSLALGYLNCPDPFPPQMQETRDRVKAACAENGISFLEVARAENIKEKIDAGVRVIAGGSEEIARIGRTHSKRSMPV